MGYAFLVSADGKILVHPDKALVMKSLSEAYPDRTPRASAATSAKSTVDGKTRIVTFAPIKGLPSVNWYIGLSVDKDKAFAMLSEFRTSAVIATDDCRGDHHRAARHADPHPDPAAARHDPRHGRHRRR